MRECMHTVVRAGHLLKLMFQAAEAHSRIVQSRDALKSHHTVSPCTASPTTSPAWPVSVASCEPNPDSHTWMLLSADPLRTLSCGHPANDQNRAGMTQGRPRACPWCSLAHHHTSIDLFMEPPTSRDTHTDTVKAVRVWPSRTCTHAPVATFHIRSLPVPCPLARLMHGHRLCSSHFLDFNHHDCQCCASAARLEEGT